MDDFEEWFDTPLTSLTIVLIKEVFKIPAIQIKRCCFSSGLPLILPNIGCTLKIEIKTV
jgi:hypothetical protein